QITVLDASDPADPAELASIGGVRGEHVTEMLAVGSMLYVAERYYGLFIYDVSNPAAPTLRGKYAGKGGLGVTSLVIAGNRAFVGYGHMDAYNAVSGLAILDVANPSSPALLSDFGLPCWVTGQLALAGSTLYAATHCGLHIINVSAPQNPVILHSYPGGYSFVTVSGGIAYTTYNYVAYKGWPFNSFKAINVSNPASPTLLHEYTVYGTSIGLWRLGQFVFAPHYTFDINNVSVPSAPVLAKRLDLTLRDLDLSGTTAYALDNAGLMIFDVSNPAAPAQIGGHTLIGDVLGSRVVGSTLYTFGQTGVQIVDIADPEQPQILGQYRAHSITDIEVAGSLIYAAGRDFRIIDASDPLAPALLSVITDTFSVDIELAGARAYLGNQACAVLPPATGGCQYSRASHAIVDVGNPAAPAVVKRHDYPLLSTSHSFVRAIEVQGDWLYGALYEQISAYNLPGGTETLSDSGPILDLEIADGLMVATTHMTLTAYDLSDPQHPAALGDLELPFTLRDIEISGGLAYAISDPTIPLNTARLHLVNLEDPTHPELIATHTMSGKAQDIEVAGELLFAANGVAGLEILRHPGPVTTTGTLTPAGGSLSSPDGALTLTFPAGAVAEPVELSLLQLPAAPHPLGMRERAVRIFRLTATGPGGALASLDQPYELTLSYAPEQLAARGIPEASLELAAWSAGAWRSVPPCAGCTLNQQANQLTAANPDLGTFVLRGRPFQAIMPIVQR
ncbi:MAG TPA: hypothetical protein VD886_21120, partial [Herpetosiphonaceae bacterium]|nr:hypothetical protein [Herpetosiphonaceae bacterium]